MRTVLRAFFKHSAKQRHHLLGRIWEARKIRLCQQVLADDLPDRARKGRGARKHEPQRGPERVDVRTRVQVSIFDSLRTDKIRITDELTSNSGRRRRASIRILLDQAEVDDFQRFAFAVANQDETRRFEVAVAQVLPGGRGERLGRLAGNFQRSPPIERSFLLDELFDGLAVAKLQRIIMQIPGRFTEAIGAGNIRMPKVRDRPGFADEARFRLWIRARFRMHDLEGRETAEIGVERLVRDARGIPAQFDERPIFALLKLVFSELFVVH